MLDGIEQKVYQHALDQVRIALDSFYLSLLLEDKLMLDGDSLKALVLQMPEISFELLRVMTARVRASERRLVESAKNGE